MSEHQPPLPGGFDLVPPQPKLSNRNRMVVRNLRLLQLLGRRRRNTMEELADALGVCSRTVRRDLEALQEAHLPVVDKTIRGRRYWSLMGDFDELTRGAA